MSADASYPENPVDRAAVWLGTGGADKSKAVIPQIRERFSLSALQAVQALRESHRVQGRAD
ncbi:MULTISPECIES: hypothetical protein [unclassified Mesorhizobium]|uniref:hypothetical protein n=1 Tax=unclassified Mesorhizobium TaxID=325217 RepID=UPI00109400E1|nr:MULTISPECIES: hypothetical protein [unclassified Mesorhizobium]TGS47554.1 hypothetical protein EN825_00870 [Mesorhizobium sp. M8A.F.Ca.ET.182.01.1.1]TGS84157.1 hypothetical protein EN824_07260 [Mesorhizobium sp. M8A.F.Ca.ET.181.01.1.1]